MRLEQLSPISKELYPFLHKWDTLYRKHHEFYQKIIDSLTYHLQRSQRGISIFGKYNYPYMYQKDLLKLEIFKKKQQIGEFFPQEISQFKENFNSNISSDLNKTFDAKLLIPYAGIAIGGLAFAVCHAFNYQYSYRLAAVAIPIATEMVFKWTDNKCYFNSLAFMNWVIEYRAGQGQIEYFSGIFKQKKLEDFVQYISKSKSVEQIYDEIVNLNYPNNKTNKVQSHSSSQVRTQQNQHAQTSQQKSHHGQQQQKKQQQPKVMTQEDFKKYAFKGIMAATFTPWLPNGQQNLKIIQQYAKDLVAQNVTGIFVCGSTGEAHSLTTQERQQQLEAWLSTSEVKNKKLHVIVHVGTNNLIDTINLAKHAAKFENVKGIAVTPPCYFKPKDEEMVAQWISEVAKSVPHKAIYYYHFPNMTNVRISINKLLQICKNKIPNMIGVKFTHNDLDDLSKSASQGYNMLVGGDEFLLDALKAGADGAIGISYNFTGAISNKIYNSFVTKNFEEGVKQQKQLTELINSFLDRGVFGSCKYFQKKARNLDFGPLRLPLTIKEEAKQFIDQNFDKLVNLTKY